MFDLPVDLRQSLFAAHGQHGVPEADEENDPHDVAEPGAVEPAQRFFVQRNHAWVQRVGGNWTGTRKTVMVHQISRTTTITVVIAMICSAFWLDSCMPWVFFRQKYATTITANPAAKWSSEKFSGRCRYTPMSLMKPARYWPADTALMGPVSTESQS